MRRLVTSDWQLADNSRDRYRTDWVVKEIPRLVEKYKPDQLLVLGDLTEHKDNHPASLVNEMVTFFSLISRETQVIILQGNHDFLNKNHPFFEFLVTVGTGEAIKWISMPSVLDNCLYLPHTRDYKKDWQGVSFKGHDYIFAHNIFEGVKANGQTLSGIPTTIFPDNSFVIAGDVHEPQDVDCVTYVGSPVLCDFGDNYQPRVLLLDDLKVKSIKVNWQQKRLVEIHWKDGLQFRRTGDFNAGDIVKVKSHITRDQVPHWDNMRKHLEKWAEAEGVILNTIQPIVEFERGDRPALVKSKRKNDIQYLDSFVSRNGFDERTAAVGKEIIELLN